MLLCAVLSLTVTLVCGLPAVDHELVEFDYYVFTLEYPPGVCYKESEDRCFYPSNTSCWTIHGLWPSNEHRSDPQFCRDKGYSVASDHEKRSARKRNNCSGRDNIFDPDVIESLVPSLVANWTNLEVKHKWFYHFWCHEYEKHGICSGMKEYEFFSKSLDLLYKMSTGRVLALQNIIPTNQHTYKDSEIREALYERYNAAPILNCTNSDYGQILHSIEICLSNDGEFTPRDCPSALRTSKDNCSGQVLYPQSRYDSTYC